MKILLTGANGQLGCSIKEIFKDSHITVNAFSKTDLDITNKKQIALAMDEFKPNIIINAAANTNVDNAEKYPDKAFSINYHGAKNIGMASKDYNIPLIHVSTDFVFDGDKKDGYLENDTKNPINSYGLSKHRGEEEIIGLASQFIIIRTSWIFSEFGKNFLKTIYQNIKLGKKLKIVSDQVGCPTYAYDIAEFIFTLIDSLHSSFAQNEIYHFAGLHSCSWYEFANLIKGLLLGGSSLGSSFSISFKFGSIILIIIFATSIILYSSTLPKLKGPIYLEFINLINPVTRSSI